jgi:hypothetical protein
LVENAVEIYKSNQEKSKNIETSNSELDNTESTENLEADD